MSDIAGKENAVMTAETGAVQKGNSVTTDLVMEGMNVQLLTGTGSLKQPADTKRLNKA